MGEVGCGAKPGHFRQCEKLGCSSAVCASEGDSVSVQAQGCSQGLAFRKSTTVLQSLNSVESTRAQSTRQTDCHDSTRGLWSWTWRNTLAREVVSALARQYLCSHFIVSVLRYSEFTFLINVSCTCIKYHVAPLLGEVNTKYTYIYIYIYIYKVRIRIRVRISNV